MLTSVYSKEKASSSILQASFFILTSLTLFFLSHCRPSRVSLGPLPSKIESIEGYGSIRISGDQGSTRSKFSFLFNLPHQARISAYDLLGRTISQIIIDEEKAVFTLPSKRVYWQGEEEEIINNFIGFRMSLDEVVSLLSGKWSEGEKEVRKERSSDGWSFEEDEAGRVLAGQRGEFRFEVREFFSETSFARLVFFQHPLNKGRLRILSIRLNQPVRKESFSLSFLDNYKRKSWAEIEKMLNHEN